MGIVKIEDIERIKESCLNSLNHLLNRIHELNAFEFIALIIILSQYLYARYCKYGTRNKNAYEVYPKDIKSALKDTEFGSYARDIILLRNMICHNYGSNTMLVKLHAAKKDKQTLCNFINYLIADKPSMLLAIEAMEGK